ncbi:insulinase family protein [bacterium]|nr:insulinase family protein [bacterium]
MKRFVTHLLMLGLILAAMPTMAQEMMDNDPVPEYTPPAMLDASPVELPKITKDVLKNGLTVYYIPQHEVPMTALRLNFPTGSLFNPIDKPGLTDMVAELLTKGTKERSAIDIAEEIDFVGGSISTGAGNNSTYIVTEVMSRDLDLGFDLMSDVILNPTFPEEEIGRVKTQSISNLMAQKDDPGAIAGRAWAKWVYGEHPYGYPSSGTIESIQEISRDDIVAQHERLYTPKSATLAISGDFDLKKTRKLVKKYFGKWDGGAAPQPTAEPAQRGEGGKVLLVDKSDAVQTQIRMGYILGPYNMGDDLYAFRVMDYLYGGGSFASRLMDRVRNDLGLTYGIYSYIEARQQNGSYTIQTSTRTEATEQMIDEILAIMDQVTTEGFTQEELDEAKSYMIGAYPRQFETPAQIANQFQSLLLFDFGDPAQFIADYRQNIQQVTLEQVNAMAKKYLLKDQLRMTVVGKADDISEVMAKYGDVETVSVEEY